MATIEQLYEAVGQLNLRTKLPDLILQTSYDMEVLVKAQLNIGELSTEAKITPSYASKYYAKQKAQLNSAPGYGTPDLFVTGAYYKGIGVAVKQDEYDIESNVSYAQADSIAQYGNDLLRLSDGSKEAYVNQSLGPAIVQYVEETTGLKFA